MICFRSPLFFAWPTFKLVTPIERIRNLLVLWCLLFCSGAVANCLDSMDSVFNQGREYFQREQFLLATQQLSLVGLLSCDAETRDQARVRWAQALYELGETNEANLVLQKLNSNSKHLQVAKIVRTWYQPSLVGSLSEGDRARFNEWQKRVDLLPNEKSATLAGFLSAAIPGAGQAYIGNYQSALMSFVLNALFLGATIEFNNKGLPNAALTSGVVFSIFYVGNITGSVQATRALNLKSQEGQRKELRQSLFPELMF